MSTRISPPGSTQMSGGCSTVSPEGPTWATWKEALRVVVYPRYLKKTASVALIVGCILFTINHLDTVLRGQATRGVWIKGSLTFLVPFCVSNIGVLLASHRRQSIE